MGCARGRHERIPGGGPQPPTAVGCLRSVGPTVVDDQGGQRRQEDEDRGAQPDDDGRVGCGCAGWLSRRGRRDRCADGQCGGAFHDQVRRVVAEGPRSLGREGQGGRVVAGLPLGRGRRGREALTGRRVGGDDRDPRPADRGHAVLEHLELHDRLGPGRLTLGRTGTLDGRPAAGENGGATVRTATRASGSAMARRIGGLLLSGRLVTPWFDLGTPPGPDRFRIRSGGDALPRQPCPGRPVAHCGRTAKPRRELRRHRVSRWWR